ncbi:hypothetical protein AB0K15_17705 [Amycolatopsis sp. NPDC049253]|uniref:hypothetical protein n=1 Tax=Amycolatopsis sp. NPDC049253 TaxID=3155274 RepID=UPI003416BFEF
MSTRVVNVRDPLMPRTQASYPHENPWDAVWPLAEGRTACVFYGSPDREHVRRPVIPADGFGVGKAFSYALFNDREDVFVSALRENGFDPVLLGYDERSASILDNAKAEP